MKTTLPVLFITHGSPILAINPGLTGPLLQKLGQDLPKDNIKAILVISAHWITRNRPTISSAMQPETIYDFGGFTDALYQLDYPVKGDPAIAKIVQQTLQQQGVEIMQDAKRGLDHGAWIPLRYIIPDGAIPVLQLSMPWPLNADSAIKFGEALKPLRKLGILIMASGSMTHNLYDVGDEQSGDMLYIKPFTEWVKKTVYEHDLQSMANYRELAPYAKQAHPTEEHFLPLIIALAASDKGEKITPLNGGITYGAISMDNYIFG